MSRWKGAQRAAQSLASDTRGNFATMTAFLLVPFAILLAGVMNFGFAWVVKNYLQVTADAAALAGASQLGNDANVVIKANEFAELNMPAVTSGDVLADPDIEIGNWNKQTRVFTPDGAPENAVRATTRRAAENNNPAPTFLGSFIGRPDWNLAAVAIASLNDGYPGCLLALHPTAAGAFTIGGSSILTLTNCSAQSNSTNPDGFYVQGSATSGTMSCAFSSGGFDDKHDGLTLTECDSATPGADPAPDPFDDVPEPPVPSPCNASLPNGQGAQTIQPGCYKGGSLKGTKTFAPGVYVFTGDVQVSAQAIITGTDVTFFFTNNATIDMNANGAVNLSAPTTGAYQGLLFWGDDDNTTNNTNKFNGTPTSSLTGAIYFPKQTVQYLGNFGGVNGCLRIVALFIEFTGNTNMSVTCPNIPPIPLQQRLALVD